MEPSKGVFFIAIGEIYVKQAVIAAKSIKNHSPGLSIALYTNIDPGIINPGLFDKIITVNEKKGNENLKTYDRVLGLRHTPFDYTLALDTDMYILADLSNLFALLDKFDMVFCHEHSREIMINIFQNQFSDLERSIPSSFPIFQGGLIMYKKNEKVNNFLCDFIANYERNNYFFDMHSLRETVWNSDVRFLVLPEEYNFNNPRYIIQWEKQDHEIARPRILHYTLNKNHDIPKLIEYLMKKTRIIRKRNQVLKTLKKTSFYKRTAPFLKKIIKKVRFNLFPASLFFKSLF
jgi:hypothetical protein